MYFGRLYQKLFGQKTRTTVKTSEEGRRNCEICTWCPPHKFELEIERKNPRPLYCKPSLIGPDFPRV